MFKVLYRCNRTIERHINSPLADSRRRYLEHLAAGGASPSMMRNAAALMYRAVQLLDLETDRPVKRSEVERAAKEWAGRAYPHAGENGANTAEGDFRHAVCAWLKHEGRLLEEAPKPVPHAQKIDEYCAAMDKERGFSPATIDTARWYANLFFRHLGECKLKQLRLVDVEQFLESLGKKGWTRNGIRSAAHYVRSFFKYGERRGWTKRGLSGQIHGPRVYRHEDIPLGPAWPDVQRLLASTEGSSKNADIRDRPILMLLAIYGLRVGEVRRIKIDDIDFAAGTLTIPRTKQKRARICPLTGEVAQAIQRYLDDVRPQSPHRELFLWLAFPHRPFGHGGMYGIVAWRMKKLGIKAAHNGPHSLRHACATHLLAQGLTLTEVGNHLGHSSVNATRIYAKVDMPMLREVANLDLGGLL